MKRDLLFDSQRKCKLKQQESTFFGFKLTKGYSIIIFHARLEWGETGSGLRRKALLHFWKAI